jgi:hypothetical protein
MSFSHHGLTYSGGLLGALLLLVLSMSCDLFNKLPTPSLQKPIIYGEKYKELSFPQGIKHIDLDRFDHSKIVISSDRESCVFDTKSNSLSPMSNETYQKYERHRDTLCYTWPFGNQKDEDFSISFDGSSREKVISWYASENGLGLPSYRTETKYKIFSGEMSVYIRNKKIMQQKVKNVPFPGECSCDLLMFSERGILIYAYPSDPSSNLAQWNNIIIFTTEPFGPLAHCEYGVQPQGPEGRKWCELLGKPYAFPLANTPEADKYLAVVNVELDFFDPGIYHISADLLGPKGHRSSAVIVQSFPEGKSNIKLYFPKRWPGDKILKGLYYFEYLIISHKKSSKSSQFRLSVSPQIDFTDVGPIPGLGAN